VCRIAIAVLVSALLLAGGATSCGDQRVAAERSDSAPSSESHPDADQTQSCRADQMRLTVAQHGSMMSQPFMDLAVTNTGADSCVLSGYPSIRVRGHRGRPGEPSTAAHMVISVRHGTYERVDRGPRRLVLRPQRRAFFSMGTATAYQGGRHPIALTELVVVLPGTRIAKTLPIDMIATRPADRSIPIGITAVTAAPRS
jgi:hypothetical protein